MLLEIMKLFFPAVCFPFHYQAPKAFAPLERSLFGLFFLIRRSFTIFFHSPLMRSGFHFQIGREGPPAERQSPLQLRELE